MFNELEIDSRFYEIEKAKQYIITQLKETPTVNLIPRQSHHLEIHDQLIGKKSTGFVIQILSFASDLAI